LTIYETKERHNLYLYFVYHLLSSVYIVIVLHFV